MTRVSDPLGFSSLPRQLRRRIERQLRKLARPGVCSFCGSPFKHNSRTMSGLDAQGNAVLAVSAAPTGSPKSSHGGSSAIADTIFCCHRRS
jgi:hypothetical protein